MTTTPASAAMRYACIWQARSAQVDWARLPTQVARALAYLSSRGIVHRDVKPQNIMVTKADGPNDGGGLVHSSSNGAAALSVMSAIAAASPVGAGNGAGEGSAADGGFSELLAVLIDLGLARRVSDESDDMPPAHYHQSCPPAGEVVQVAYTHTHVHIPP